MAIKRKRYPCGKINIFTYKQKHTESTRPRPTPKGIELWCHRTFRNYFDPAQEFRNKKWMRGGNFQNGGKKRTYAGDDKDDGEGVEHRRDLCLCACLFVCVCMCVCARARAIVCFSLVMLTALSSCIQGAGRARCVNRNAFWYAVL